ncbi:MAG TPA: PAS domain S-box protein, partial [Fimbriimonadaceae bacterium]|nr:PAS domain S-box protein [Fimbriimonadaceae bacterium]
VLVNIDPLRNEKGEVVGAINAFHDLTAIKAAQEAQRQSEERYRAIVESQLEMVCRFRVDGTILFVNGAYARSRQTTPEALIGANFWEFIEPEDREGVRKLLDQLSPSNPQVSIENRFETAEGTRWTLWTNRGLVFDEQGRAVEAQSSGIDITDRKWAEEALREETRALETLNRVGSALAAELDTQKLIQAVTDAGRELSGAAFGAFFFNSVDEKGEIYQLYTLSGAPREAFEQFGMPRNTPIFHPTFAGEGTLRSDDITQDPRYGQMGPHYGMPGGHLPVRSYLAVPVVSRSGAVLGGLFFGHPDPGVFTQKAESLITGIAAQAAVALDNAHLYSRARDSEERFRAIADNIPQLAWMVEPRTDGSATWFNKAWLEYTGTTMEQNQGSGWHAVHHPDHAERVIAKFERHVRECLDWEDTFPLRRYDGEYRWFLSRMNIIRDEEGNAVRIFGTNTDITERFDAEERLEQAVQRRTADLLAANEQLQGFTYSVAHDLRQQIRGINTNASMLLHDAHESLDEESRETLRRLITGSRSLGRVVDDLLSHARLGRKEPAKLALDISALAEHTAAAVVQAGTCNPSTRFEIAKGLMAQGDPAMMRIVLENLIDNACKYSAASESPLVEFGREGEAFFVRDNGVGFDMRYADKLFQPFERLHEGGGYEGTGIGLANVKRIIDKHGGRIWAESSPGHGATFYFTLG